MSAERQLYIDIAGNYSRVALTEDGELLEFMIDAPEDDARLAGNIYKGRVQTVLPGMQAAFIEIGRHKNAFLYVSDMPVDRRDFEDELKVEKTLTVRVGQDILCQVIKDEVGQKGARVSTNISLVGRYIIGTPTLHYYGISRKITDPDKRAALGRMLPSVLPEGWGGIARTQSAVATKRELRYESEALTHVYGEITERFASAKVGDVLYGDGELVYRVARDVVDDRVDKIVVNDASVAEKFQKYLKLIGLNKIKVLPYPSTADLFGDFDLTRQINKLLSNRVILKNGGSLVIDKTEALTAIDVNSAKFVGSSSRLEDTVFMVNIEAAKEIARQLRLRNLGGMIIVDFIDMEQEEHRREVMRVLEEALQEDRIRTRVVDMTPMGLVEITRKKIRRDIRTVLQEPCPHCGGSGQVIKASTVVPKVAKLINKAFLDERVNGAIVTVHAAVAATLQRGALSKECETVWKKKRVYVVVADPVARDYVKIEPMAESVYNLPDDAQLLY